MAVVERAPEEVRPVDAGSGPRVASRRRTLVLGLVVTVLTAVLLNSVLQAPLWWGRVPWPATVVMGVTKTLDVLVLWLALLFLVALLGRLWTAVGVLAALVLVLTAVDAAKLAVLQEPLVPGDRAFLSSPGFLLSMVSPVELAAGLLAVVAAFLVPVLVGRRMARRYPRARGPRVLLARLVVLLVTGALLADTTGFNDEGNRWRQVYDASGASWAPYSQAINYRINGFVGGLLYNMPIEPMAEPPGYSEATMREISQRYAARAETRNVGRDPSAMDDVNVVLVLSESFADPDRLAGLELERDPIPRTRAQIHDAWGGSTLANFYGTGTSSMEFQALTGQNLALFNPQVVAPYQNFVSDLDSYPSAVGWFAQAGHVPIAVHPYSTEMYRRSTVYPMLGFEDFVHDTGMQEQDRLERSDYISDRSAFDEVEHQMRVHDQPVFVNLVTMQNHVPMSDLYDDPIGVTGDVDAHQAEEIGGDARGMEYSDEALEQFLTDLRASDEKTVVVFYGDHYPGIYSDAVLDQNPGIEQLQTPLLIWSSEGQDPRPLPLTSSNDFLPYAFDLVGQTLPPYYELLTEVREQIGALSPGHIVAPDGTELTEDDLTPEQAALLADYRLVQYDFSVGQRYAVDDLWYSFSRPAPAP